MCDVMCRRLLPQLSPFASTSTFAHMQSFIVQSTACIIPKPFSGLLIAAYHHSHINPSSPSPAHHICIPLRKLATPSPKPAMADSTPGHFADELAAKLNLSNGKRQLTNRFEELPPEVRRHIFCFLDLQQLSTLIHASPVYFQQYLEDRKSLLCGCLGRSLGSIAVDAFTIHRFASLDDEQKRGIPRFLKEYSDNTAQRCFPLSDNLADTEVVSMAAFHLHVAKPLSEYFGRWLLENLARQPVSEDTSKTDDRLGVTPSEATRLTRATYRFHLLCQMGVPVDYDYRRTSSLTNIHGLLDILQPWEAEEMFCFYQFAHHKYEKLLGEVREDLVQDDPEFAADHDRPSTPEGGFRWSRPCKCSDSDAAEPWVFSSNC